MDGHPDGKVAAAKRFKSEKDMSLIETFPRRFDIHDFALPSKSRHAPEQGTL
jgi:hypothetical protein